MQKNKIFTGVIVILGLALVFVLFGERSSFKLDVVDYSVVYLSTGEVYVGKLSTYRNLVLTDAYIYQVNKDPADPNKTNFQLQPISEALWAPSEMHFIKNQVIFYGPLSQDSKIYQTLKEQAK